MITRNAEKEELQLIRDQRIAAYAEHAKEINEDHWKGLEKAISSEGDIQPGSEMIVAEIHGEILGSVVLFPAKTDAYEGYVEELEYPEIRMLAVSPEARGQGVAKALILECIRRAKEKGYDTIGLHTGSFMKNAIKLYEQFGFERIPQYDFEPANDGIIVKAFRLSI
ncbi:GNAT family N-acetyltransferase [Salipaludibacillus sp. CF4.18]|uniref:GNAT family N-acetyltransferase n=1 Tax=Salipaludibacillus sp. CF4.18 TaxID=3373081 RepID=UPI003EE79A97